MSIYERTSGHKKLVRRSRRRPTQDEETEVQAFGAQNQDSGGSADEMDTSMQQAVSMSELNEAESNLGQASGVLQHALSGVGYLSRDQVVDPTTQRFIENAETMRPHPLLLLNNSRPQHHVPCTPYGESGAPISLLPRFPADG